MPSQKELKNLITQSTFIIQSEQEKIAGHQKYFTNLLQNNNIVLVSILLPSFLAGWKLGKHKLNGKYLKKLAKTAVFFTLSLVRKHGFNKQYWP